MIFAPLARRSYFDFSRPTAWRLKLSTNGYRCTPFALSVGREASEVEG